MRKLLESWRGKAFSVEELAGFKYKKLVCCPCRLVIKHEAKQDGSIRDIIADILKPSEAAKALKPEGTPTYFDFDEDMEWPTHIPEGITKIAQESYDWKSKFGGGNPSGDPGEREPAAAADDDDDLPF
jgi:hypothetical protein